MIFDSFAISSMTLVNGLNLSVDSMHRITGLELRVPLVKVAICGGGFIALYHLLRSIYGHYEKSRNDVKRETKIVSLSEAKNSFEQYLRHRPMSQTEIDHITSYSLSELIEKLQKQELTPAYVLLAFQHKALQVDKKLNCVVEFLYPDLSEVNFSGPLAGVPVSIKECFGIKGHDVCCGCVVGVNDPHPKDDAVVKIIRGLGGVPFVRTVVPQTMLSVQCSNPIDGVTLNPLRQDRTSHGSSGGEAALVGGGGSIVGFGSDLGGSVRLPAAMCGIVGFKPTTGRLTKRDASSVAAGKPIQPTWGPLCRDVESCQLVMEAVFRSSLMRELDPYCPPAPFAEIQSGRNLRIGYFLRLDELVPVPAVRRAVLTVRDRLASRGHELVEWKPPITAREYMAIFLGCIFSDGCEYIRRTLNFDKQDPCISSIYRLSRMPFYRRWWLQTKYKFTGDWESSTMLTAIGGVGAVARLEALRKTLQDFRYRVLDSLRAASIDVLLCPAAGFAAAMPTRPPHSYTGMLVFQNLANSLELPAGTMPSGCTVEPRDLAVLEQAVNGQPIESAADQSEAAFYADYGKRSPVHRNILPLQKGTEGLPIPVQFMSLPWQDELCLYAMREAQLSLQEKVQSAF